MRPSVRPYGGITIKGSPIKLRAVVILQGKAQWPYWAQFWSEWDWKGLIRPQLDAAAALGCNAVQINGDGIGDNGRSYPSDDVFRARVVQICNYAAQKGLVVLWQLGYRPNVTFPTDKAQRDANIASAAKVAGWVNQIHNVVTLDGMNEWDIQSAAHWTGGASGNAMADMIAYIKAIRANFSRTICISVSTYGYEYHASIAPYVDYHNYHNYDWQYKGAIYVPKAADLIGFKSQPWYKGAFIIGETGIPLDAVAPDGTTITAAMRRAFMDGMRTQAEDPDCLGCFNWGCHNTTGAPDGRGLELRAGKWGAVNDAFQPYPEMAEPIAAWPGRL